MPEIVYALLLALVLDWMLGDPVWMPHPIVWFGRLIAFCEHRLNKGRHRMLKGAVVAVMLIVAVYLLVWLLPRWLDFIWIFFCLAGTTLIREVKAVFLAVDRSLDEGRAQVARIVGRDTSELSAQEVRTAALETLAENLSDGVIAPLFWLALLGVPGMMAYKMVNTLDSMIGYRTERYRDFGCWAAHIDDVANYIPARLTALLMVLVSGRWSLLGFVWHYGRQHASPNSGYPEAALAGILDCRFGGPHYYFGELFDKPYIGNNERKLTTADMKKSIQVNRMTEILMVGLVVLMSLVMGGCTSKKSQPTADDDSSLSPLTYHLSVKYATGFTVRDSADVRLVDIGEKDHFALVRSDEATVPEGYTKVRVPIQRTICMTALQLSNFTILDAHDVVKGLTGTKNLFNKDIQERVKDGRIVKIGMEGNFDTEMVLAANPDVIFVSPFKRGGYDAIKETGITLVPHLGYKELDPLGQAEWIKFVGMFIGKEKEACEIFAGIEQRYNDLKLKIQNSNFKKLPTVFSGEMHGGTWHAVGGKNYLAQIFRDAGAYYVIQDEETAGENLEFEKMYELAANADFWRILNSHPGEFSYDALKASEPRNELFKSFKERKVIYCNMKQTPYYEISPVEPDLLLKDFVAIFHPELVEKDYQPTFYHLLK